MEYQERVCQQKSRAKASNTAEMFNGVHQAIGMEIRESINDVAKEIYFNSFKAWSKYKSFEKDSIRWPSYALLLRDVNAIMEISLKNKKNNRLKGYCLGTWILDS